ncbi:hypothetical protein [Thermococcus chitonophagus]|uniref:hypothetical protein n=1 Tax=Thermococcus chitonophagus TaxID=54262 RepID=UPI0012ED4794|nr:hypothetical protein [Thermococcus chitonophagus]
MVKNKGIVIVAIISIMLFVVLFIHGSSFQSRNAEGGSGIKIGNSTVEIVLDNITYTILMEGKN